MDRPFRKNFGKRFSGPRGFSGPREMHKATCAECGNECEVPFKPRGDRPVYCKECFLKRKGITPRQSEESEEQSEEEQE